MVHRRSGKRSGPPSARQVHEDDGIDPRKYFDRRTSRSERASRGDLRLCAAAARALSLAFSQRCRDAALTDCGVRSVEPAPDASRLRVVVVAPAERPAEEVAVRLSAARPFLRAEVAAAVRRKRAPDLSFVVVSDDLRGPEGER